MSALRAGRALSPTELHRFRRSLIFEAGKLDPHYADHKAFSTWPLILSRAAWSELCARSVQLYEETVAAEQALLRRPDLWGQLGLPRRLRLLLRLSRPDTTSPRLMRFDWHPTTAGWQVSEVNADVPGGELETSFFRGCFVDQGEAPPDPMQALAEALGRMGQSIGLVVATGWTDDWQVARDLRRRLQDLGATTVLGSPASFLLPGGPAIDALFRFFPAEWLPELWPGYPVWRWANPGPAINPTTVVLTQSKALPLVWNELGLPMGEWRRSLPATAPNRPWSGVPEGWIAKPALGRVGEGIDLGQLGPKDKTMARRDRWWRPRRWVWQRRFESVPVSSPDGPAHAVLGVYVLGGEVCGVYARVIARPPVDGDARDTAVLLEP